MVKSALHLHHLNAHACTTPQGAAIRGQCGAGGCKHRHDTAGNHVLAASAACSWGRRHNQVLVRIRRQQVAVRMQVVLEYGLAVTCRFIRPPAFSFPMSWVGWTVATSCTFHSFQVFSVSVPIFTIIHLPIIAVVLVLRRPYAVPTTPVITITASAPSSFLSAALFSFPILVSISLLVCIRRTELWLLNPLRSACQAPVKAAARPVIALALPLATSQVVLVFTLALALRPTLVVQVVQALALALASLTPPIVHVLGTVFMVP
mmetsp:Transcript_43861/g.73963  ORF Transcript_43861/g.73963 Transcript_43861/m.73963 type:complete len:262 (+) Transcript_43861:498-1283(+)